MNDFPGVKCYGYEPPRKTNADRIRSMSDEELASYLCNGIREGVMMLFPTACYSDEVVRKLEHDWLDWLRQEAK